MHSLFNAILIPLISVATILYSGITNPANPSQKPTHTQSPQPTTKPTPIATKTPAPTKSSGFISLGPQTVEEGITAEIVNMHKTSTGFAGTVIFKNISSQNQEVNPGRVSLYSATLGWGQNPPSYFKWPLSPGQSHSFNLTHEMPTEPTPYTWKYAKLNVDSTIILGTYK